ncbi:MAG TPA: flippase [Chloroflexia bacterium]|nr:flippase [Chloroflexia bacterium]
MTGPVAPDEPGRAPAEGPSSTVTHVRGSSLLLVGRVFALALGFGAQVLMVRYLTKADFGAFSYALSVVTLLQSLAMLEMANGVARFLPLYREQHAYGNLVGTIRLAVTVVLAVGTLLAVALISGLLVFGARPTDDARALQLLAILAILIPIQGLDNLFNSLFAAFGSAQAILLRQSILAPGLRMLVVLVLIGLKADVLFLTSAYLLIAVFGVLLSAAMFRRLLARQSWQAARPRGPVTYPVRELFGFALPLLGSTLVWALISSSDGLLLGYLRGTQAVAEFRAVLPLAEVNMLVSATFATLYLPLAARLHAQDDQPGLATLYWQTALWMAVLSFPVFVVTFSFAPAVTETLYGAAYTGAAPVLALLALGYFFQTALGFNGLTLKVQQKLRYVLMIDLAAAVLNVLINLVLIPPWGAAGAAAGTAGTLIIHNLLKQFGLWKYAGITLFQRRYAGLYAVLFGVPLALLAGQTLIPAGLWIALPVSAAASLLVLWLSRAALQVATAFPELERLARLRVWLRPRVKTP